LYIRANLIMMAINGGYIGEGALKNAASAGVDL
jgi:hypothetical protein